MDVGGKFFVYCVKVIGADKGTFELWKKILVIIEVTTTVIEAMVKYSHARNARAGDILPHVAQQALTKPLLEDTQGGVCQTAEA